LIPVRPPIGAKCSGAKCSGAKYSGAESSRAEPQTTLHRPCQSV